MDLSRYGPWAFIAGGSEGVGASFARSLAAGGINLVIAARKREAIQALAAELRQAFGVEVRELPINLCAVDMLRQVEVATRDIEIGMLICNAGAENSLSPFLDRKPGRAEMMIALNVTVPTQLAYHFGSGMRERRRGGIIIVGSNSCHAGAPRQVVYSAAKAYQFNFAEGLWAELRPHDVHVLGLILGLTNTPNLARTGFKFEMAAGLVMSEPDDVVRQGFEYLGREPIHCIGGWTERWRQLRGLPRGEAMAMVGHGVGTKT
ncbi:Short-chain dehydrogenase [Novosphingobium sp. CF614]|uniref:SDR family NAD(P)-dependent oxidoreductase n=1 Tax=Novosphingobium sp. CF614 TaxID=1884364 RepID=UPI0008F314CD|nr:SDR family NAD(P)-dependent oxidoreductase [Novosphingobium sp. CF614]SFF99058.1 Short-chain dehydrogenase [Novosphingobium sp. CF614]